jgi:hypothetical protein
VVDGVECLAEVVGERAAAVMTCWPTGSERCGSGVWGSRISRDLLPATIRWQRGAWRTDMMTALDSAALARLVPVLWGKMPLGEILERSAMNSRCTRGTWLRPPARPSC